MLALPSRKKSSSKNGCECLLKFQMRLVSSNRSQNCRPAWSTSVDARYRRTASRSIGSAVLRTGLRVATVPPARRTLTRVPDAVPLEDDALPGVGGFADGQRDLRRMQA